MQYFSRNCWHVRSMEGLGVTWSHFNAFPHPATRFYDVLCLAVPKPHPFHVQVVLPNDEVEGAVVVRPSLWMKPGTSKKSVVFDRATDSQGAATFRALGRAFVELMRHDSAYDRTKQG